MQAYDMNTQEDIDKAVIEAEAHADAEAYVELVRIFREYRPELDAQAHAELVRVFRQLKPDKRQRVNQVLHILVSALKQASEPNTARKPNG